MSHFLLGLLFVDAIENPHLRTPSPSAILDGAEALSAAIGW